MKKWKKTLALLLTAVMVLGIVTPLASADPPAGALELTINDGTKTNSYVPVYGNWADAYQRTQFVITADQILDLVHSNLQGMRFYLSAKAAAAWTGTFEVYLGPCDTDTLDAFVDITTHTLVYEGTLDGTGETMDIEFDTDYLYTSGNLLVTIQETEKGNYKNASFLGVERTGAARYAYNSSSFDGISSTGTPGNFAPKTTLYYMPVGGHTHNYTSLSADGATITAICTADDCFLPNNQATLTIAAPTLERENRPGNPNATLSGLAYFTESNLTVSADDIVYYAVDGNGETQLAAAPTTEGSYIARYTLGNATAGVSYAIAAPQYTTPAPTSKDGSGITNVSYGTSGLTVNSNPQFGSSGPFYLDYTDEVGSAEPGDVLPVSITLATGYTYSVVIWVDWNQDCWFSSSEVVCTHGAPNTNPYTFEASISVPGNQTPGSYRMRICAADSYLDSVVNVNGVYDDQMIDYSTPTVSYCVALDYTLAIEESCANHVLVEHPAVAPTCTEDGTLAYYQCETCGKMYSDAQGSIRITAADIVDPAAHDWGAWTNTIDPTCTEAGEKQRSCSRCTETETAPVDALGHDWSAWANTLDPTCTEAGEKQRSCSRCTETETEPVDALGHDWGAWTVTLNPTCTEDGEQERSCSRCPATETQPIDALGHDPGAFTEALAPTCTQPGREEAICNTCGNVVPRSIDPLGHDWGAWTTRLEPTCTEDGEEVRTCSRCPAEETRPIDALDHDWIDPTSNGNGTHTWHCSRCTETETEDCTYDEESENGITRFTCTECGYSYTAAASYTEVVTGWYFESDDELDGWTLLDRDGANGTWDRNSSASYAFDGGACLYAKWNSSSGAQDWAITPAIDLSGVSNASVSVWMKKNASSYVDSFEIWVGSTNNPDAMTQILPLTEVTTSYVNYTADLSTFVGQSEVYVALLHHTSADSFYLLADNLEILTAYGASCDNHVLVEHPAAAATCTEPAYTEKFYQCEACRRTYSDAAGNNPILLSDISEGTPLGHSFGDFVLTTPAGCETEGVATATCTRCFATRTMPVDAFGHDYGDPYPNFDGTHSITCTHCGGTETEACNFDTYTENGISRAICTDCGYTYVEEIPDSPVVQGFYFESDYTNGDWTFIDADGNNMGWILATDSAHEGTHSLKAYWNTNGAEDWAISPAVDLSGVSNAQLSIWAAKMPWNDLPDYMELWAGTSSDYTQMTQLLPNTEVTALYNDSYENFTVDLSAFDGESAVYIGICHRTTEDSYYLYVDQVEILTGSAGCTSHVLELVPAVQPSCAEDGHSAYYQCTVCGRTYLDENGAKPVIASERTFQPALGHDWSDWTWNNDEHTRTCARCGLDETSACSYVNVTEIGVTNTVCSVCGHITATQEGPSGEQLAAGWYFESTDELTGWKFIDNDGDGNGWFQHINNGTGDYETYEGNGILTSESYKNATYSALTPDNWAISPEVSLSGATAASLSFYARGQEPTACEEVFRVYVWHSDDPNGYSPQTNTDFTATAAYTRYELDLSAYLGERVRIVFRHYNCTDQFCLNLDNVEITATYPDACAAGTHTLSLVPAAEPTCTTDGNTAYYACSTCGRYYLDENGTQPTSLNAVILPAAHNWGAPTYDWDMDNREVTGTCVCQNDDTHVLTETAALALIEYVESTATVPGHYTVAASFTNPAFTTQTQTFELALAEYFTGTSLTLDGAIGDNLYVNPFDFDTLNFATVEFTWNSADPQNAKSATVALGDATWNSDNSYCVTAPVSAKEMTDEITATLKNGNTAIDTATCSVQDYAMRIINNTGGMFNGLRELDKLQELCRTMLIYGAKSQLQFNYHTDALADAQLADPLLTPLSDEEKNALVSNNVTVLTDTGLTYAASSLLLKSQTTYRLYFTGTPVDNLCVLGINLPEGVTISLGTKGIYTYVDIENIPARNLLDTIWLSFCQKQGNSLYRLTDAEFNAGAYIRSVVTDAAADEATVTLKNTVTALYRYCKAAEAYFNAVNAQP